MQCNNKWKVMITVFGRIAAMVRVLTAKSTGGVDCRVRP